MSGVDAQSAEHDDHTNCYCTGFHVDNCAKYSSRLLMLLRVLQIV